jgi:SOS-response transcriptional repressor LexA
MTFGQLLTQYRERSGLSKTDLSKRISKTQTYVTTLETGVSKPPTFEVCEQLVKILQLSESEKNEFLKQAADERIGENIQFYNEIGTVATDVPDAEIPVVSKVSANDQLGYAHFIPYDAPYRKIKINKCKAMDVASDSMAPVALKGQSILYDEKKEVRDGDLALVILNDESQLFKRYFRGPKGYITLQSVNSMYPPVIIEEDRVKELYKVVGVWF